MEIDKLETSDSDKSAARLIAKSKANALKRSTARAAATTVVQSSATREALDVRDVPHDPFQDNWYAYEDKYQLNPAGYVDLFSETVRKDQTRGGGCSIEGML